MPRQLSTTFRASNLSTTRESTHHTTASAHFERTGDPNHAQIRRHFIAATQYDHVPRHELPIRVFRSNDDAIRRLTCEVGTSARRPSRMTFDFDVIILVNDCIRVRTHSHTYTHA